ncbi:MAG: SDR family oxidoreductase [Gemmatimonadetes bacterium]|nr:SDR family oxidoreductase [Gemmatimonadota bacterium]
MPELRGRRALVCGASHGIGQAAAVALAEAGATVVVLARDASALREVRGQLPAPFDQAHDTLVADFRDPDNVESSVKGLLEREGPIEVLINNTGGPTDGPLSEAEPEDFLTALDQHLGMSHRLARALVPGMREHGYGRIVNVTSTSVRLPIAGLGVSNTVRAAVHAWVRTLAAELGPDGITVNNVLPGYTDTGALRELLHDRAERLSVSDDELAVRWRGNVPLGRFADPAEVAAAIRFLASPAASYITGIDLPVDGGRIAVQVPL